MDKIFIKAVNGRSIRDPDTKELLSESGELKPRTGFWLKRIKQGDVVESKAPKVIKDKQHEYMVFILYFITNYAALCWMQRL